jgi:hypothetical protein
MKAGIILTTVAMAAILTGCWGNKAKKAEAEAADVTVASDKAVSIFNGKNFDGWRGYNLEGMPENSRWTVEDGAMKINGNEKGEGDHNILYATPFKNFRFTFEWKVSKGANSGVFFYVKEVPASDGPYYITAPEYQILDNENHPDARLGVDGNRTSSSLYDMIAPKDQNAKPIGEWNTGEIMVYQGTVVHYQNGVNELEYHLWTPEWTAMIEKSKFASNNPNWPKSFEYLTSGLGTDAEGNVVGGYILLQDHGTDVWFRNLRVEEL